MSQILRVHSQRPGAETSENSMLLLLLQHCSHATTDAAKGSASQYLLAITASPCKPLMRQRACAAHCSQSGAQFAAQGSQTKSGTQGSTRALWERLSPHRTAPSHHDSANPMWQAAVHVNAGWQRDQAGSAMHSGCHSYLRTFMAQHMCSCNSCTCYA